MKNVTYICKIVTIVSIFVLSSCYTRKQAVKKFCHIDTALATVTVHDTVIVKSIVADTVFSTNTDSVIIIKNRLEIKYKRVLDKVYLSGQYHGDTIYKERIVEVKVPCNCPDPPEPVWYESFIKVFAIIGLILLVFFLYTLSPYNK